MLSKEWIEDFYKKYEKVFEYTIKDMRKHNINLSYLLFESFKELSKSNNDYDVIIKSNTQYDKHNFKLLEANKFIRFPQMLTYCQGITHLTTNLLAIVISCEDSNVYKLQFVFNGKNDESLAIKLNKE